MVYHGAMETTTSMVGTPQAPSVPLRSRAHAIIDQIDCIFSHTGSIEIALGLRDLQPEKTGCDTITGSIDDLLDMAQRRLVELAVRLGTVMEKLG